MRLSRNPKGERKSSSKTRKRARAEGAWGRRGQSFKWEGMIQSVRWCPVPGKTGLRGIPWTQQPGDGVELMRALLGDTLELQVRLEKQLPHVAGFSRGRISLSLSICLLRFITRNWVTRFWRPRSPRSASHRPATPEHRSRRGMAQLHGQAGPVQS